MSLEKAHLRSSAFSEVSQRLLQHQEAAKKEVFLHEGGELAVQAILSRVEPLFKLVDEQLEQGVFDSLGKQEIAQQIKNYLIRVVEVLRGYLAHIQSQKLLSSGRVKAFAEAAEVAGKLAELEIRKVQKPREPAPEGHPGPSIAQLRRAESEKLEESVAKPNGRRRRRKKSDASNSG